MADNSTLFIFSRSGTIIEKANNLTVAVRIAISLIDPKEPLEIVNKEAFDPRLKLEWTNVFADVMPFRRWADAIWAANRPEGLILSQNITIHALPWARDYNMHVEDGRLLIGPFTYSSSGTERLRNPFLEIFYDCHVTVLNEDAKLTVNWSSYTASKEAAADLAKLLGYMYPDCSIVVTDEPHEETIFCECFTFTQEILKRRGIPPNFEIGKQNVERLKRSMKERQAYDEKETAFHLGIKLNGRTDFSPFIRWYLYTWHRGTLRNTERMLSMRGDPVPPNVVFRCE